MKKLIKNKHFIVTIIVLLITLVSFSSVIIKNNSVFILYGDSVEQYYQFLLGFWQKVHDGNFAMFDYTNGYGANVYSMVYYNMFSPFTWLILLLKKEWIMYAVLYLQILKMIVLANFSVLWLSKLSKNNNHILIGSLILTFSGWVFFYWHYDFLNSIVFYPLILYFIEIYLQDNKTLGLIISTCLLTICNYYFMYMFVPFACLYALFRYITLNKDNTFKKVLFEGIRFALIFVLSIFAGSFVLVPCIKIILESGRISDGELNLFITFEDFFRIFTSLFTPVFSRIEPNRFILISKTTYQGWGGGASIYTSLVMLMFIPTTFFINEKKKRNCLLIFGSLISIFMISPYFYKLFQGSIDTRFFYMTVFTKSK